MKRKIIIISVCFIMFLYLLIFIVLEIDKKYNKDIFLDVEKNTDIGNVEYVNVYDNYYIIKDKKNLYLYTFNFDEITRVSLDLIHKNSNNYDIIYKDDSLLYMNSYKKKKKLIFEYYNIYSYELVDKIVLGGK